MKHCPTCQATFSGEELFCPHDGTRLGESDTPPKGRLAGASLAGLVNLDAFLFSDHLGERYLGRLLSDGTQVRVLVFHRKFDTHRYTSAQLQLARLGKALPTQVLSLHSLHVDDDPCFMIEENAARESMDHLLRKQGALPWKQAAYLAIRLARILDWLASLEVPHRLIHPRSIFVDNPKISSIQVGELAAGLLTFPLPRLDGTTPEGAIPVYPGYLAPEWFGDPDDVDLHLAATFTAGAVLLDALGHPLWNEGQTTLVEWTERTEDPEIDLSAVDDAPDALAMIARRMVAPSPSRRFQAPTAAMAALSSLLGGEPDKIAPPLHAAARPVFQRRPSTATSPVPFPATDALEDRDVDLDEYVPGQTQMGLPATVVDRGEPESTDTIPPAIDDPGDISEVEEEPPDRTTEPMNAVSDDDAASADDDAAPGDEESDDEFTPEKKTLMMGVITLPKSRRSPSSETDPEFDEDSADEESDDEDPEKDTPSAGEDEPAKQDEPAAEEERADENDEEKEEPAAADEPTPTLDEPDSSIIVDPDLRDETAEEPDDAPDDASDEPAAPKEPRKVKVPKSQVADEPDEPEESKEPTGDEKPAPASGLNIGFVEVENKSSGSDDFEDAWLSNSQDAWEESLVREAYEESRLRERALGIGVAVVCTVLAIVVVFFTLFYEPPEEEPELADVDEISFVDVDELQRNFDAAMERGELLQPRSRSALMALRELERHADPDDAEEARERFISAALHGALLAEERGQYMEASVLIGHASNFDPDDEGLRERAVELRQLAEGGPAEEPADAGADDEDAHDAETTETDEAPAPDPGAATPPRPTPQPSRPSQPASGDAAWTFQQAQEAFQARRYDDAKAHLTRLLTGQSNHAEGNALMARIYFDVESDHQSALRYQRRAVNASPNNISYRLQLGRLHYRLNQFPQAIEVWEAVLEIDAGNTEAQRWIDLARRNMN